MQRIMHYADIVLCALVGILLYFMVMAAPFLVLMPQISNIPLCIALTLAVYAITYLNFSDTEYKHDIALSYGIFTVAIYFTFIVLKDFIGYESSKYYVLAGSAMGIITSYAVFSYCILEAQARSKANIEFQFAFNIKTLLVTLINLYIFYRATYFTTLGIYVLGAIILVTLVLIFMVFRDSNLLRAILIIEIELAVLATLHLTLNEKVYLVVGGVFIAHRVMLEHILIGINTLFIVNGLNRIIRLQENLTEDQKNLIINMLEELRNSVKNNDANDNLSSDEQDGK